MKAMRLQVTLFAKNGKYKPISTVIEIKDFEDYENNKIYYQTKAIANICHNRHTTWQQLKSDTFTIVKVREYNIQKIKEDKKKTEKEKLIEKLHKKYKKGIDKTNQ